MTRIQIWIVLAFLGSTLLFLVAWGVADAILFARTGESISWSMDRLGFHVPFLAFVVGHVSGGVIWGLAMHFWGGMGPASLYEERDRLQARVAELEAEKHSKV